MGRIQYSGGLSCRVSNCSARNRCKNRKTDTKIFSTRFHGKILTFCLKHLRDYQTRKKALISLQNDSPNANWNIGEYQEQMKPLMNQKSVNLDHNYYFQQDDINKLQNLLKYVHHLELKIEKYKIPIWPSREIVKKYMPECFINKYPSTRLILDGTEIFIEKPLDYTVQSSTYSVYKAHNTARGIIGVTPNGFVCFVSELYPGRTSEKEIVLNSGLLEKLEPGDSVMADKGFTICKELAAIDVDLNIPPFSYGNNQQFTDADEILTRDIASVRVHIERVIRNVKLNRILLSSIPNTMADQLNQIWVVCCCLTNFRKNPLLDIVSI